MFLRVIRYLYLILGCIPVLGIAQTADLNQIVSFQFYDVKLEDALSEISYQYQISFAYSRDFIPVYQRIRVEVNQLPLQVGLDRLFESTQVVYAVIGSNIALRIDERKKIAVPVKLPPQEEVLSEKIDPPVKKPYRNYTKILPLQRENYALLLHYHLIEPAILDSLKKVGLIERDYIPNMYEDSPYRELSQVTFVPTISTNKEKADSITNTFSLNIFYGINGGVEGIEVGGFGNELINNMKGLQVSCLLNRVYGTVSGVQFAGILNHNSGYTRGFQFTLGANLTNETKAIQMAGLMNIAKGDFAGLQAALVGNYARKKGDGVQVAIIFNKAGFNMQKQFALLYNEAGQVQHFQVGIINKANYVKGTQIGILNIAKEVRGTPIGLFNFIKNGYNRIEVGGGESLFANVGFKFGKRKFYNLLQFGYRFTNDTWSLGYGIGTGLKLSDKQYVHFEWIMSHVNEGDWWTRNKNWLHQFRCSYDWNFGKDGLSLFAGPILNWSISTIRSPETDAFIGSSLPSYTFLDTNRAKANWKMWIGATAGLRF